MSSLSGLEFASVTKALSISAAVLALAEPKLRLRGIHWSKEASSLGFALPYRTVWIKVIGCRRIETMVEAIIRRWCRYVGWNNFTSRW
jgi:hypothetical protein